jgi:hypothetical protein
VKKNIRYQIYKGSSSGSMFFYTIFDTEVFDWVDEINRHKYYTPIAETYDESITEQLVKSLNEGNGFSYVKQKYTTY